MINKLRFMLWAFLSIIITINVNAQQNISDSTKISKQKQFETNSNKYKPVVKTMKKVEGSTSTKTSKIPPSKMATAAKGNTSIRTAETLKAEIEVIKTQISAVQENSFYSVEYLEKLKYALFLKMKQLKEFHPQIEE